MRDEDATAMRSPKPSPGGQPSLYRRTAARLRACPEAEHEIASNRLVISLLILAYLGFARRLDVAGTAQPLVVAGIYFSASVVFLAHLLVRPTRLVGRRVAAMAMDIGALSYGMHVGGHVTSLLYPIYLWITFGHGFRFGVPYLVAASGLSVAGFAAVIASTPYWVPHLDLSFGLLAGLVVLPLYAATLIRKLSAAKRQAEEASKAKSMILASVSHELRTPLNAVIGMSDLLRDTKLDHEQRDMTRTIRSSARSLLALIDDILDLSRAEAGMTRTESVDFELTTLLGTVRATVAAQARAKGLRIAFHVTAHTPPRLHGDVHHLQEILVNLVGNAVKFTSHGMVVVGVDAASRPDGGAALRIEVSDTGIGIAPDARGRIFESFAQADETIINRFGGTGLGLAIARQLVRLMGGEIGVESEVDVGSTFWLTLDLQPAAEPRPGEPRFSRTRLVVWSPLASVASPVVQRLSRWGAEVMTVSSVGEAVGVLQSPVPSGCRRQLVVMDGRELAGDVATLASTLLELQVPAPLTLALVDDRIGAGLPPLPLRGLVATTLPSFDEEAGLATALRLAGIGDPAEPEADVEQDGRAGGEPVRPLRILVAEDNRTNQRVIGKVLERAGHDARIVDNGEQALDALDEAEFDLVLMDVNMPVMSGIEATKLYRFASLGQPRVPIVALTADATLEARDRCTEAGMDAWVTKPVAPDQLLQIIASLAGETDTVRSPEPPAESVTQITSHPRFRAGFRPAVDQKTLANLEALGGKEFVADLVGEFIADAGDVLHRMRKAAEAADVRQFRDGAHALRSSAANIGAGIIAEMCLGWRQISPVDLVTHGNEHVRRLEAEVLRVRASLLQHRAATGDR